MEKENLEHLFKNLNGQFDFETPDAGHQARFLKKMNASKTLKSKHPKKNTWWKPLAVAASIALLATLSINQYLVNTDLKNKIAEISPEISQTEFYFSGLIENQIEALKKESAPETRQIIDDTLVQLKKLEKDYTHLENDLINGGNSKLLLKAMVINFQTRIDLLEEVIEKIDNIKNLKYYEDAKNTI